MKFTVLKSFFWGLIICLVNILLLNAQSQSQGIPSVSKVKVDSTFYSKKFIKGNISANFPFDGQKIALNLHSISFLFTIKNSFSHEFGFINASYQHSDDGNSIQTQMNLLTYYQFSYIFLTKYRIRPYISFKTQPLWYYYNARTNIQVGYERGNEGFGLQHRSILSPGLYIVINKSLLIDFSLNLFANLFFVEFGYKSSYTKNPNIPANQQSISQPWFDYSIPPNFRPQNGIFFQIGLAVKLDK